MIDAHCHLSFKKFNRDRDKVVEESKEKLEFIVDSGATYTTIEKSLDLGARYPGFVFSSLGIHPYNAASGDPGSLEDAIDLIRENAHMAVSIGETGLDFKLGENIEGQEKIFLRLIDISNELGLPLVVHAREAEDRVLEILKEKKCSQVLFHCFGGSLETAGEIIHRGYFISLATNVCFSTHHQDLVKNLRLENIMLETDSPYLSPSKDIKRNHPVMVIESAKIISGLLDLSIDEIDRITSKNAREFYRI